MAGWRWQLAHSALPSEATWLHSPNPLSDRFSPAEDHTSLHHPHTCWTGRQSPYHIHIIILKRIQLPQIEMTWISEIGDPFKYYRQTHIISTHPLRPEVIIQQHDWEAHQQINGSTSRRPQTLGLFVDRIYGYYILNTATKILLNPVDPRGQHSKHDVRRGGS